MVNYENCVISQKSKHSTVPHWTSGNSALFKRLISDTKSFSIVISKWVKCFNLVVFYNLPEELGWHSWYYDLDLQHHLILKIVWLPDLLRIYTTDSRQNDLLRQEWPYNCYESLLQCWQVQKHQAWSPYLQYNLKIES